MPQGQTEQTYTWDDGTVHAYRQNTPGAGNAVQALTYDTSGEVPKGVGPKGVPLTRNDVLLAAGRVSQAGITAGSTY